MEQLHLDLIVNREVERWFRLLSELETHKVSSADILSKELNVTYRTVNSDVAKIKDYFSESISLISTRLRYEFRIVNPESYQLKKQELLLKEPLPLILDRLFQKKELSFFELVDELHFSESTLFRYLKRLGTTLSSFQLELTINPVALVGDEIDIRNFYLFYFYETDRNRINISLPKSVFQFVEHFFQQFRINEQTTLPFLKFCYIVHVTIERCLHGFQLVWNEELLAQVKQSQLFKNLAKFKEQENTSLNSLLTEEEIGYICLFALINQEIDQRPYLKIIGSTSYRLSKNLSEELYRKIFLQKEQLFESCVKAFIEEQVLKYSISPTCLLVKQDVIQHALTRYSKLYHQVYEILNQSKDFSELFSGVNLEHFTAITTIRLSSITDSYIFHKHEIIFLYEGNEEMCLNLKALTKRYLGQYFHIHFLDYEELAEFPKFTADLLVTNCQEYKVKYEDAIEVLLLQSIPTEEDWTKLIEKLHPASLQVLLQSLKK